MPIGAVAWRCAQPASLLATMRKSATGTMKRLV